MTKATRYGNQHAVVETYNNVTFVIKLLVVEKVFEKILGHGLRDNGKTTNMDLFQKETAALAEDILLQNYIYQI